MAGLNISSIPFKHNLAAVKIGEIDGDFIVNPSDEELANSVIDLTLAGTEESVLMIVDSCFLNQSDLTYL